MQYVTILYTRKFYVPLKKKTSFAKHEKDNKENIISTHKYNNNLYIC